MDINNQQINYGRTNTMATTTAASIYIAKWKALPIKVNPKDEDENALNIQTSKYNKKVYVSCSDFDATVVFKNDTFVPNIYYGSFPKDTDMASVDAAFEVLWNDTIKPFI